MSIDLPNPKERITIGMLMGWLFKVNQIMMPLIGSALAWVALDGLSGRSTTAVVTKL